MRHDGHIRQRSEGTFELRYSLGNDPVTGKWKVKTVTFKGCRKDAQRELQRILKTLDEGTYVESTKITVRDFLKEWLETVRTQVSVKTHERYDQVVNSYLIPAFGNCLLAKLTPSIIQQTYNGWETSGRQDSKAGGLSPRTRLHIHRVFKSALKHAVQFQLAIRNPADAVKPPKVTKTTLTTLTIEQSGILLDALRDKPIYMPVLIALTTGMRRGEILALRWKNVDFGQKTVRVVESLEQSKKGIRFKAPKTERTRAVILPDYVVGELKARKEKQAEELAELKINQNEDTLVCCRFDGDPIWPTSVTHEFIKAIRKLPHLPRVRFHDLRHSHATQLLAAGIHPKIAQERLGHSTITTTLDLYSHATTTMQDDAASKLDTALRSVIKARPLLKPTLG
jgi:integrase